MCFSLIEMHFNVVQISFLQLQSKLATCLPVCVRASLCVYAIYTGVYARVCVLREEEGEKEREKKHSHSWKRYFCWFPQPLFWCLPLSQTHIFSTELIKLPDLNAFILCLLAGEILMASLCLNLCVSMYGSSLETGSEIGSVSTASSWIHV